MGAGGMTIREKVARAICQDLWAKGLIDMESPPDAFLIPAYVTADAAITAFLAAAAEEGWHMRPDEATREMVIANCELDCGYAVCHKALGGPKCVNHGGRRKYSVESWETMLAEASEFEWDK